MDSDIKKLQAKAKHEGYLEGLMEAQTICQNYEYADTCVDGIQELIEKKIKEYGPIDQS